MFLYFFDVTARRHTAQDFALRVGGPAWFRDALARSVLWALGGHFDCTQGRTLRAAVRAALG